MVDFTTYTEDASGNLVSFPLIIEATATTNGSGLFSVDISGIGLTHIHTVSVSPLAGGTAATDIMVCNVHTFSTTTVSGAAYEFTSTLGVLGLTAATSKTIYVTVVGDQA